MSLLTIFIVFVVAGVALYLIRRFVPMEKSIIDALTIVVIVLLLLWVVMGVAGGMPDIWIGN